MSSILQNSSRKVDWAQALTTKAERLGRRVLKEALFLMTGVTPFEFLGCLPVTRLTSGISEQRTGENVNPADATVHGTLERHFFFSLSTPWIRNTIYNESFVE